MNGGSLFFVTENGRGKRTNLSEFKIQKRAGKDRLCITIPRDKSRNNAVRGYAFINFVSSEACEKAVTASTVLVAQKTAFVQKAVSKEALQSQRSKERSEALTMGPLMAAYPYLPPFSQLPYSGGVMVNAAGFYDQNRNRNYMPQGFRAPFPSNSKSRGVRGHNNQGRRQGQNAKDRGQRRNNNMGQGGHSHKYPSQIKTTPAQAAREVSSASEPQQVVQAAPAQTAAPVAAPVAAQPEEQEPQTLDDIKQALGEKIYEKVMELFPNDENRWGKLTGMLLESIKTEELKAIIDNSDELNNKIREANKFYEEHVNQQ